MQVIEQLQGFPENVVAFAGRGQVTKADYVSTLIPAVETALAGHDRLRLYYELGGDFAGIDADAIVEDFKVGMQHRSLGTGCGSHRRPVDRPRGFAFQLSDARCDKGLFDERCRSSAFVDRFALFIRRA